MQANQIFTPFAGMLVLTMLVWMRMFHLRIGHIRQTGVQPSTRADLDAFPPRAVAASNNFTNLFEVPVLFYATVLALHALGLVDAVHVACAYGFLVFRVGHSLIHCTYNETMHRFGMYAAACTCLWVMVVRLLLAVVAVNFG